VFPVKSCNSDTGLRRFESEPTLKDKNVQTKSLGKYLGLGTKAMRWEFRVFHNEERSDLYRSPHAVVALGGVVVSVLATGPKVAGSNPAKDDFKGD
jgi:hypothetical protein